MLSRLGALACCLISLALINARILTTVLADDSASPAPPTGPKYNLRYKFQPGEEIRTQVWHQANSETTIAGTSQSAESTSGSVKVWRIKSVEPDGTVTFEHSVESVEMRQKLSDHQEVTYNSKTDKEPPPIYAAVAKEVGVRLAVVTIDASGKVLKRIDRGQKAAAADPQSSDMVVPLPAGPVAVGESWDVPQDVTISLEENETKLIKTRQHYTLEKVVHGVATISVATQVLTPVNNPAIQSQLVQRLTQGTIRFDLDAGRVLSKQLDLDERVLGFHGADSSVHFVGRFTEEDVPSIPKTAAGKSSSAKK
ncbi:MAG TPA: hypothetical protein VFE46_12190 [Pirellulales bacterium]|jgi:hypothetical protein|nr:hypothetical protein [Pirellulales bacterium]